MPILERVANEIKSSIGDYEGMFDDYLIRLPRDYYTVGVRPSIVKNININLKHNLSKELEILDNKITEEYNGSVDFLEAQFLKNDSDELDVEEEILEKRATEAFENLINSEKSDIERLLYFYFLSVLFLESILSDNEEKIIRLVNYEIFDVLKPYVVAQKLHKEFSSNEVQLARKSISSDVEEVDVSKVPPYLLEDNSALVSEDGKYYLVEDILKAITAAGGVAQTLERQDLEGGVTNANRQTESRPSSGKKTEKSEGEDEDDDSSGVSDDEEKKGKSS